MKQYGISKILEVDVSLTDLSSGKIISFLYVFFFYTGDPIRDEITNAILHLQETDVILSLKNKWWRSGQCTTDDSQKEDANELGLENIGGIFLVLIAGLVLGVLVAVAEFVWKSRQNAEIDRVSKIYNFPTFSPYFFRYLEFLVEVLAQFT